MKLLIRICSILTILIGVMGCTEDYSNDTIPYPSPGQTQSQSQTITSFKATLNGASEAPSNPSAVTATGQATLLFNTTTKIFTITVIHNVVSPTSAHIHNGDVGLDGPIVFPLNSATYPIKYTSSPLTPAQEAELNADQYYVNIHSAAFPDGEIRGQLLKQIPSSYGY